MDAKQIHRHFITLSSKHYPLLGQSVHAINPLWFPENEFNTLQEFLFRSIIGQQLSVKAARSIWERVLSLSAEQHKPLIELMTIHTHDYLRACGISRNKIRALISVKEHFDSPNHNEEHLKHLDHETRSKELIKIWGIGQWTCDMSSIFYFQDQDVWPIGDVGIRRGLEKALQQDKLSEGKLTTIGNKFKPYRSFLSLYAWHILDTGGTP